MSAAFFSQLHACKVERISIKAEDPYTIYMNLEICFSTQFKKKQLRVEFNLLENIFKIK